MTRYLAINAPQDKPSKLFLSTNMTENNTTTDTDSTETTESTTTDTDSTAEPKHNAERAERIRTSAARHAAWVERVKPFLWDLVDELRRLGRLREVHGTAKGLQVALKTSEDRIKALQDQAGPIPSKFMLPQSIPQREQLGALMDEIHELVYELFVKK